MRFSKYEKNMLRSLKRTAALAGKGVYVYQNNTRGDLMLPRPTKSGVVKVLRNEQFQGDDYYMFMVRNNELSLVKTLEHPNQNETINEGTDHMSDKLITEQPPMVTNEGTVEYQVPGNQKHQKLNENKPNQQSQQQDILLNENPLDGIEIL